MAETFGAELRRLRLAMGAGLTQRDLADAAGKSPQYVNDLEHGRRTPNRAIVERMLAVMVVMPDEAQYLRELAFRARGECCPRCGFGREE